MKVGNLSEQADQLLWNRSYDIICDLLVFEPKENKAFTFSDDSKKGNNDLCKHPDDIYLIHVDTERNVRDQYSYAIQRMIENAEYAKVNPPKNLCIVPLVSVDREERFTVLEDVIRRSEIDKHIVIVLDVVTDCNQIFNDPKESMKMVDRMNKMINHSDYKRLKPS